MSGKVHVKNVMILEQSKIHRRQLVVDAELTARPVVSIDYHRQSTTEQRYHTGDLLIVCEFNARQLSEKRPREDRDCRLKSLAVKRLVDRDFKNVDPDLRWPILSRLPSEYIEWLTTPKPGEYQLPTGLGWDGLWPQNAYARYYRAIGLLTGAPVKWANAIAEECKLFSDLDFSKRKSLPRAIPLDGPCDVLTATLTGRIEVQSVNQTSLVLPLYTHRALVIKRGVKSMPDGTPYGVSWELFEN